jgi:heat shock protein HslJ
MTKAWQLKEFTTVDGPVALSSRLPTLYFQDSVHFSGFSGCNRYSGKYELKGKKITFSRIVSTHIMCAENMEVERQYQQFVPTIARFSLRDNELTLRDESGKARAVFVPILLH